MNTSFFSVRNSVVAGIVFLVVLGGVFGNFERVEGQYPGYTQDTSSCSPVPDCSSDVSCGGTNCRQECIKDDNCASGTCENFFRVQDGSCSCYCRYGVKDSNLPGPVAGTPLSKCDPNTEICNPIGSDDFEDLINGIIRWLTIFATPILVLMVVYAGFLYTTSAGSTTQTDRAKNVIKHAVIGFIIITLAYVIKAIVGDIF